MHETFKTKKSHINIGKDTSSLRKFSFSVRWCFVPWAESGGEDLMQMYIESDMGDKKQKEKKIMEKMKRSFSYLGRQHMVAL